MNLIKKFEPSHVRKIALFICYTSGLVMCHLLAWQLRFDFSVPESSRNEIWNSAIWFVPLQLLLLAFARQYSGLLGFFSVQDLIRLFVALFGSSLIAVFLWWGIEDSPGLVPPRGVILINFVLSFMGLSGVRLAIRLHRERDTNSENITNDKLIKVGIVGAGHSGANLAKELFMRKGLRIELKYFFDDNSEKYQSLLHGIPILGKPEILLDTDLKHHLDKLIIALPAASGRRIKEVVNITNKTGLTCEIVPSMEELTMGRVSVSKLRKVQIQDLLRRDPVQLQTKKIKQLVQDKVIIVTGAGGSIGSELCRQVVHYNVRRLLLIEQCEAQMFSIQQELYKSGCESFIVPIVADVIDSDRMESVFQRYKPEIVFHAAAHKHVTLMEQQPNEAFRNNTEGTVMLADMAARYKADHFILVSTDKAINPTSVMGATKRLAEVFVQSMHASNNTPTNFIAVRFGNVLGSSGSVVPIFEEQIDEGGPVTVSHPEVTRYFMTIPEAVGLILQATSQSKGGEIFALDMGDPVKIIDLAHQLIELHGHKPGKDIEIEITGLKPGEKLFEEISHKGENIQKTDHSKILRFVSEPAQLAEVRIQIQEIGENLQDLEADQIKLKLREIIPEYQPYLS